MRNVLDPNDDDEGIDIQNEKFYEEDSNEIYLKENSKFAGYISLDLEFCYELEKVLN